MGERAVLNTEPIGNTTLFEHGIHTEKSDLRAHVCVSAGKVYVFPTVAVSQFVQSLNPVERRQMQRSTWTRGIETAKGYILPVSKIPQLIEVNAKWAISKVEFHPNMSTTEKGNRAVAVVQKLLRVGWFPLPINPEIVRDVSMQHSGFDVIVTANHRIEVKCDYNGGSPNGTGNLYLQTHECNPWRQW